MSSRQAELEAANLQGNLRDAQHVEDLATAIGIEAVPFLLHAIQHGAVPVAAAALRALSAIDPERAAGYALTILRASGQDSQIRAAAAQALSAVHTDESLTALLGASLEGPMVSTAAIGALSEHRGESATARLYGHLRSLVEELRSPPGTVEAAFLSSRFRAVMGIDGQSGLLGLVVARCRSDMEADLLSWWRTHPMPEIQAAAAHHLMQGGVDNACAVLREGLPGAEPHPTGTGELDNGAVRAVLAYAVFVVLQQSPPDAYQRLERFFEADQLGAWFGQKRAEIIILLLLGQLGFNETTWLWGYADALRARGARPDARWRVLGAQFRSDRTLLRGLVDELCARHPGG